MKDLNLYKYEFDGVIENLFNNENIKYLNKNENKEFIYSLLNEGNIYYNNKLVELNKKEVIFIIKNYLRLINK
jgi:hypothetical protein